MLTWLRGSVRASMTGRPTGIIWSTMEALVKLFEHTIATLNTHGLVLKKLMSGSVPPAMTNSDLLTASWPEAHSVALEFGTMY